MDASTPEQRRKLFLEVVENQIRENDPPETKSTLRRLIAAGTARQEAMRLIACVLAAEIHEMMQDEREFDRVVYVGRLAALPKLPWEDEEEADTPLLRARRRRLEARRKFP